MGIRWCDAFAPVTAPLPAHMTKAGCAFADRSRGQEIEISIKSGISVENSISTLGRCGARAAVFDGVGEKLVLCRRFF